MKIRGLEISFFLEMRQPNGLTQHGLGPWGWLAWGAWGPPSTIFGLGSNSSPNHHQHKLHHSPLLLKPSIYLREHCPLSICLGWASSQAQCPSWASPRKTPSQPTFWSPQAFPSPTNGAPLMHEKQQEHHQPARFLPK